MKIQITTLILGIFLIGMVSAIYPGETIEYEASNLGLSSITNVTISENLSEILYNFTNELAIIKIPWDASEQTFIISFYGYKEEIPVVVHRSSGGGSTNYWTCDDWGFCLEGTQKRECYDLRGYGSKITEVRDCIGFDLVNLSLKTEDLGINEVYPEILEENETANKRGITGAFAGTREFTKEYTGVTILLIVIIILFIVAIILGIRKIKAKRF